MDSDIASKFSGLLHGAVALFLFARTVRYLTILFLTILSFPAFFSCSDDPSLALIPELDVRNLEQPVIHKIDSLQKMVAENPHSAGAWGKFAMNLFIHGFEKEAFHCYEQASKLDPTDFRWPYFAAYTAQRNNLPGVVEWYQRSQKINPRYAPISVRLGEVLLSTGQIDAAQEAFQQALKADSTLSHAWLGLAQVALSKNDPQTARQLAEKALQKNPGHREVRGVLATILRRLNQIDQAARQMEIAKTLPGATEMPDPVLDEVYAEGVSSAWRRRKGMVYLENGNYPAAVREFKAVLAVSPTAHGYYDLGHALHKLGNLTDAIENYQKALSLNPNFPLALSNLGAAYLQQGRIDESIQALKQALKIKPGYPGAAYNLFNIYKLKGDYASALAVLRAAKQHNPDDINLTTQLAWTLATTPEANLRNGPEAVSLAEFVCQKTNYQDPVKLDALAAAYAETGQFRKAIDTAKTAYQLAVNSRRENLAQKIQFRLALYEKGKPFQEERKVK